MTAQVHAAVWVLLLMLLARVFLLQILHNSCWPAYPGQHQLVILEPQS